MDDVEGWSVLETSRRSGVSRSLIYVEIAAGRLKARKVRGRTVILSSNHAEWIRSLPSLKSRSA